MGWFWDQIPKAALQHLTHRHTDHATCDVCSNRPHLCTASGRCGLKGKQMLVPSANWYELLGTMTYGRCAEWHGPNGTAEGLGRGRELLATTEIWTGTYAVVQRSSTHRLVLHTAAVQLALRSIVKYVSIENSLCVISSTKRANVVLSTQYTMVIRQSGRKGTRKKKDKKLN